MAEHFKSSATPLDYISPVNEPQWKWGEHPGQEGSGATNAETARLIRLLGAKLQAAKLSTTITAGEAAQVNFLYSSKDAAIGNQLEDFFYTGQCKLYWPCAQYGEAFYVP